MKYIKPTLLLLLIILLVAIAFNYRKLNIIAGYASKNIASSTFLANRPLHFTDSTDINFTPINIASNSINTTEKTATSSVFGLLTRKSIYREGVGSVVIPNDYSGDATNYLSPKRTKLSTNLAFPYGDKKPKDTVFNYINYTEIQQNINTMFADINQTRAVVVVHKNHIIAEQYAEGFNENSLLLGWSMTKSILGTLFGVLQHQQKINVFDKAPIAAWQNDARKDITIHNLLQMNSGLAWTEDYNTISDVTKMLYLEEDMTLSQKNKPLVGKPNQTWNYSSGTSNLLSGIIRDKFTTHQEYLDYWYSDLIDKIGMHSMLVETDLKGNYIASSYSWATARDWSKFGLLYLNNGLWNGEQIFSDTWVDYATQPTPTSNNEYGATVWLNKGKAMPDVAESMYYFRGYQGQYIFVLPEQELVIVRLGLTKNADINKFVSNIANAIGK